MYIKYDLNGKRIKDRTYFIGYMDVFELVARAGLVAAGPNPMHINTGLEGKAGAGWVDILGPNVVVELEAMTRYIGASLVTKDKVSVEDVKNYEGMRTSTSTLWNMVTKVRQDIVLSKDGPNISSAPELPGVNPDGGMEFLSQAGVWGNSVGTIGATAPDITRIFENFKLEAFPYAATEIKNGKKVARETPLLDRNPYPKLTECMAKLFTALNIGSSSADRRMWGPMIFGEQDEANKIQSAVELKRVINVRSLALYWQMQPVLVFAHAINQWLFGGAGDQKPVYEQLVRGYRQSEIEGLQTRLSRIAALPVARVFKLAIDRIGWTKETTNWGDRPTLVLPRGMRELVNGGAASEESVPEGNILRDTTLVMDFVDEVFDLITTGTVAAQYELIASIPNMSASPTPATYFGAGPMRSRLLYSDGVVANEPISAHDLFGRPIYRLTKGTTGIGLDPEIVVLHRQDPESNPPPLFKGHIDTLVGVGVLHETGTPLAWRPANEYQDDDGATWINLTLEGFAATVGASVEAITQNIIAKPDLWSHLFTVEGAAIKPTSDRAFRSARTEDLQRFAVEPKVLLPDLYIRWNEARPVGAVVRNRTIALQERRWYAVKDDSDVIADVDASKAITQLLTELGVSATGSVKE